MSTVLSLHHRPTRVLFALATGALLLAGMLPVASAQKTPYTDVPQGAYYEDAAAALLRMNALDSAEVRLRPSDLATRAELVKLLVHLNDTPLLHPSVSSFNDISRTAWYFPYFEAAADAGWVHGDRDCYQRSRPCTARPADPVNRAEAAALINRSFQLEHTGRAPQFPDAAVDTWYSIHVQTAADHCVLQGDEPSGRVRPAAYMNRAEMVVMFYRASQNLTYGVDCGAQILGIDTINAVSPSTIRVRFTGDVAIMRAEDPSRYVLVRSSNGAAVDVLTATLVDARTVELRLDGDLQANVAYMLTARNLLSTDGALFSDTAGFTFVQTTGHIMSASALSSTRVRLTFDTDIDRAQARIASLYSVVRASNDASIAVSSAIVVDDRTVDLQLGSSLAANVSYRVTATHLLTRAGDVFSDSALFVLASTQAHINSATALSATRVRVTFDTDLDRIQAQVPSRYSVARVAGGGDIDVLSAVVVDNRTVNLQLATSLSADVSYVVTVSGMRTSAGAVFSDSAVFSFPALEGHITSVTAMSSTRLRIAFNTDLDAARAQQTIRYTVRLSDGSHTLPINTATLLDDRHTVDLTLYEPMQTQRAYTVNVQDMLTSDQVLFSDSGTTVFTNGDVSLGATLTGGQEVPLVITTASGTGSFTLKSNGLQYDVTVRNMSGAITAAHFHLGDTGANGPILFTLNFNNNHASGMWTGITADQRNALLRGGIYVNVHTAAHPDGEIRGQLTVQ